MFMNMLCASLRGHIQGHPAFGTVDKCLKIKYYELIDERSETVTVLARAWSSE